MNSTMSLVITAVMGVIVLGGVGYMFVGDLGSFQDTNDPAVSKADCELRAAQGREVPDECVDEGYVDPSVGEGGENSNMIQAECPEDFLDETDSNGWDDDVKERWVDYDLLPDSAEESIENPEDGSWFWVKCTERDLSKYAVKSCSQSDYKIISKMTLSDSNWGDNRKGYCPTKGLNGYYDYGDEKYTITMVSDWKELDDEEAAEEESQGGEPPFLSRWGTTYALKISNSSGTVFSGFDKTEGDSLWPWTDALNSNRDATRIMKMPKDSLANGEYTVRASSPDGENFCSDFQVSNKEIAKKEGCSHGTDLGEEFTVFRQTRDHYKGDYHVGFKDTTNLDRDEVWRISRLDGTELFGHPLEDSWIHGDQEGNEIVGAAKAPRADIVGEDGIPEDELPEQVILHYPVSGSGFCAGFFNITGDKGVKKATDRNQFCIKNPKRTVYVKGWDNDGWESFPYQSIPLDMKVGFPIPDRKLPVKITVGDSDKEFTKDEFEVQEIDGKPMMTIDGAELDDELDGEQTLYLTDERFGNLLVYLSSDGPGWDLYDFD